MIGAGIVLCGGKSTRMGFAKAQLPFGDEVLLQRVTRILGDIVSPLVVVASPGQELPRCSPDILVAYDRHRDGGPLEGLAVGFGALPETADAAFVTGCDAPFLKPLFIRRIFSLLESDYSAVVPRESGRYHPLCAVFRKSTLPKVEELLTAGERRMTSFVESISTREVAPTEWCDVDPNSDSLRNLNNCEDYSAALEDAGIQNNKNLGLSANSATDS